jgi:hypothetical protein
LRFSKAIREYLPSVVAEQYRFALDEARGI